jgi:hypothetical protein
MKLYNTASFTSTILFISSLLSTVNASMMRGGRGGRGRDDEQSMILRITNQAYQQPFSEFFVMIHNSNADPLYVRGQRASDALAQLAENGTPQNLQRHYQDMDGVLSARVHEQGVPPGGFTDILVTTSGDYPLITIASMAVNTNDCFVSLNGADLSPGDVLDTAGLDAGSEENNELCTSIPGPACPVGSGNVHSGGDGEGFVHVHRGIHGVGDLIEADTDWRNPMMRVVVLGPHN